MSRSVFTRWRSRLAGQLARGEGSGQLLLFLNVGDHERGEPDDSPQLGGGTVPTISR
ncbi:MAG: hypothetical protein U1F35_17970 [Steroidobacteraceae bacterium]